MHLLILKVALLRKQLQVKKNPEQKVVHIANTPHFSTCTRKMQGVSYVYM